MDRTQLVAFCEYMIGYHSVGGADAPNSPELRAFIVARLGDATPTYPDGMVPSKDFNRVEPWTAHAKAFAGLLREVADGIDPPQEGGASA